MTPKAPATKYLPNSSWLSSATAGLKSVHGPERLLSFKRGPVELEDGLSLVDRTTSRPGSVLVRCLVEPGWLRIPMMLGLWHRLIVDSIELDTALAASSWVMPPEAAILGRSPYNASTNSTCRGPRDPGLGWHGCLSSATAGLKSVHGPERLFSKLTTQRPKDVFNLSPKIGDKLQGVKYNIRNPKKFKNKKPFTHFF